MIVGPEGETAVDASQEEAVAGADDGGAAFTWTEIVVEGLAIGEGDAGGIGVDLVFVNNRMRDV